MTDLPDNVDLRWIGKTLIEMQLDLRDLRDQISVNIALTNRLQNSVDRLKPELRALTNKD